MESVGEFHSGSGAQTGVQGVESKSVRNGVTVYIGSIRVYLGLSG